MGEGLQDHPAVLVSYGSKKRVSVTDDINVKGTGVVNPITVLKWLIARRGAMTSVSCEFGGFFRTAKEHAQPDLQVPRAARARDRHWFAVHTARRRPHMPKRSLPRPDGVSFFHGLGESCRRSAEI